jgi:hypothetical protein
MPIPVGRSGNVDGEGGTADGVVRDDTIPGSGWVLQLLPDNRVRVWVESLGEQWRELPGLSAAISDLLAEQGPGLRAPVVALKPVLAELTDHADDHGADDA